MDTSQLGFTRLQNEIFRILCIETGVSLNQREVAKALFVSPTAVAKALKGLEKDALIKVERSKTMNLISIRLNRDNPKVIALKRVENLKQVYESDILGYLDGCFPGSTIIIFGSYSQGEDTVDSDIDIAIIGYKEKDLDLSKYEKILKRSISLHNYMSLKEINRNLKGNILNGITLQGVVEL